jgi:uncharacterized protein YbjT (DUF2867 family)
VTDSRRAIILVAGATGRVGRLLVYQLLHARAAVRALTRDAPNASLPPGVEVMAGDFTDPPSLDAALDDVTTVFLVWTAPVATAADVIARLASQSLHLRRRVVYLSAPHQTPHPFFQQPNALRALHVEIERLLAAAPLDVTILRPGMFASNVLHWWAPQIRSGDVVRWPYASAETAPIDERDIAAVAARTLLDSRHDGGDYVLTGPDSLTQAAQVGIIADVIGRPLRYEQLSPDAFRRQTTGTWPPAVADMLLAAWAAAVGQPAYLTSAVRDILGAPPRTFRQWVADNAGAFTPR